MPMAAEAAALHMAHLTHHAHSGRRMRARLIVGGIGARSIVRACTSNTVLLLRILFH